MKIQQDLDIIGIGASTVDLLMPVDEFGGSEGAVELSGVRMAGGGPVATACVVAAHLGVKTAMLDRVGTDWRGDLILKEFETFNVCTEELVCCQGKESPLSVVQVRRRDGARRIFWHPGTVKELVADELPVHWLRNCRYLHLNGRHSEAALAAAELVEGNGDNIVSFDGGGGRYSEKVHEFVGLVDWWIVARNFATAWLGDMPVEEQVRKLLDVGKGCLAGITDGGNGAWFVCDDGQEWHQPAYPPQKVVDTTGCGDVFHGAFLASHARGMGCKEAGRIAAWVASCKAGGFGGRANLPRWQDCQKLKEA